MRGKMSKNLVSNFIDGGWPFEIHSEMNFAKRTFIPCYLDTQHFHGGCSTFLGSRCCVPYGEMANNTVQQHLRLDGSN